MKQRADWKEQTPSWLISLGIHAAVLVVLACIGWRVMQSPQPPVVVELGTAGEVEGGLEGSGDEGEPSPAATAAEARTAAAAAVVLPAPLEAVDPASLLPEPPPAEPLELEPLSRADPAMALLAGLIGEQDGHDREGLGDLLAGTSSGFQKVIGGMRTQGLDIVLVIDATNSMAPYIEQAKARLRQIVGVVNGLVGVDPTGRRKSNVRFGIVAYKDYGDDYGLDATQSLPLTDEMEKVYPFIDRIRAGGGGDEPEPIHDALRAAADPSMGWRRGRRAVLVLVADAPVHALGRAEALERAGDFSKRLRGTINIVDVGGAGQAAARTSVLDDLNRIADAGGGSAFLLKEEQQFWKHLIISIFGHQFEQDVQTIVEKYGEAQE